MTVRDVTSHQLNAVSRKRRLMSFSQAPILPCSRAPLFVLLPCSLALFLCFPSVVHAGWVQQQSGTTASLQSVYFINAQTGWVAGDSSFILKTTDGGSHWERYPLPSVYYPYLIKFWDSQLGFVATRTVSYPLYRSTDGGIFWQPVPLDISGIIHLAFITPSKGWLVCANPHSGDRGDGALYQTTDGGESWVLRDYSFDFMYCDIAFADTLFGMFTTDNHPIFNLVSTGFLERTTNSGATWDTLNYGYPAYGHLRFGSPNYAWRTTHSFTPGGPHYLGVQKTTNRGESWTTIWGSGPSVSGPPPIAIPDTLNGWMIYWDTLFNTRDAGATWSWQIPGRYLNDLCFTDSQDGWLVGSQGLILHTTDGGSGVWEEPSRLPPYASRLTAVPNPFTSFATVPGYEIERFSLYDVSGRRVGTFRGDRVGEGLSPGVYFIKAESGSGKPVRVVKVR